MQRELQQTKGLKVWGALRTATHSLTLSLCDSSQDSHGNKNTRSMGSLNMQMTFTPHINLKKIIFALMKPKKNESKLQTL